MSGDADLTKLAVEQITGAIGSRIRSVIGTLFDGERQNAIELGNRRIALADYLRSASAVERGLAALIIESLGMTAVESFSAGWDAAFETMERRGTEP
jgi:hypothetical protein